MTPLLPSIPPASPPIVLLPFYFYFFCCRRLIMHLLGLARASVGRVLPPDSLTCMLLGCCLKEPPPTFLQCLQDAQNSAVVSKPSQCQADSPRHGSGLGRNLSEWLWLRQLCKRPTFQPCWPNPCLGESAPPGIRMSLK